MNREEETTPELNVLQKVKTFLGSVLVPLGIFVIAQLAAAAILSVFIPGPFDEGSQTGIGSQFVYVVFFELLALALAWFFVKWRKRGLDWLGLGAWPKPKDMLLVFPVAGVYIFVAVVSFYLVELLQTGIDLNQNQDVGFEAASSSTELLLAFLALVVVTPLTEEVLMRGFMFRNLNRTFGFVVAALVSASIFGLLHGQVNLFIDTFVLGLALAWLVNKTNSLWPAIGLHSLKNSIAFLYLFVF